ncbi:MAG: hypothetical protein R6U92_05785 [Bacillota bacterium]
MKRLLTTSLVILSILVLLFAAAACGGGGEESEPDEEAAPEPDEEEPAEEEADEPDDESGEEEADEADDEEFAVDSWRNPSDIKAIREGFSRLVWRWAEIDEDGNETDPTRVTYQFEGEEEIDGTKTEKLSVTIDEEDIVFWVDEEGKVARLQMGGETVPGEMAGNFVDPFLSAMFWPFKAAEELQVRDVLNREGPGWEWEIVSTETRTISDMQAEVTRIRLNLGPPHVPEGSDEVAVDWEIGDFGDFQMLIAWNSESTSGDGIWEFTMEVEEVELR